MHLDVSREQLAEVVAHWRTSNKEMGVPQRFGSWRQWLHWSAFGTDAQSARASGVGCGTCGERLEKQQLANVSCHKVDLNWPDNLTPLLVGVDTVYYGPWHG